MKISFRYFTLFAFSVLIACSGGDNNREELDENMFSCFIDNKFYEFGAIDIFAQDVGVFFLQIAGSSVGATISDVTSFQLLVNMGSDNTQGTYTSEDICDNEPHCVYMVVAFNLDQPNQTLYGSGDISGTNSTVRFDELVFENDGFAKGSFSGLLINDSGESLEVVDGKFQVNISL